MAVPTVVAVSIASRTSPSASWHDAASLLDDKSSADVPTAMHALIRKGSTPLSALSKAMMQTNKGAGSTKDISGCAKAAISAVAVVKAGPEIARQSNRMLVPF